VLKSQVAAPAAPAAGAWETFAPEKIDALRASGRPVFVDFTAAWCLTCQVNERLVLDSGAVRRGFAERGIALLRADWTNRDPAIARALEAFGRSGVPLYVLYGGGDAEPRVLPTILTPAVVLDAIAAVPPAAARVASAPPPET
jgi:thiol:disulfide interchange protein DsbD